MPAYPNANNTHRDVGADAAYIYIGGWSDFRGPDDSAIDFGLQYSPARHAWDWAAQFSRSNPWHSSDIHPVVDRHTLNLQPGTIVTMTMNLLPQNQYEAKGVTGVTMIHCEMFVGPTSTSVWKRDFPVYGGAMWNTAGYNQYFKRMVSIAQVPAPPEPTTAWIGEGNWHKTWIRNVTFCEGSDSTWVLRAVRNNLGVVDVPAGSLQPRYTLPLWTNLNQSNGPLNGHYLHPDRTDAVKWEEGRRGRSDVRQLWSERRVEFRDGY